MIILIRATISRDLTSISGDREFFGTVVSVVIMFVIFLAGVRVFSRLPQFGLPVFSRLPDTASQAYIERGLADTGAANIVTSVYLDYRAYDTLGEATVLFTAVVGAIAILREKSRKSLEDAET